jgi:hypothetical protein
MPQRAFELADCRNPSVSFLAQPGKSNGVSSYVSRGRAFFVSPESDIGLSEDLESLQALFNKYCDNDGLMSKDAVIRVPFFAELLVSYTRPFCLFAMKNCVHEEEHFALELLCDNARNTTIDSETHGFGKATK